MRIRPEVAVIGSEQNDKIKKIYLQKQLASVNMQSSTNTLAGRKNVKTEDSRQTVGALIHSVMILMCCHLRDSSNCASKATSKNDL